MRRIFIILGFLFLVLFFISSNANAVTPITTPASPIPCTAPNATFCLTTQECRDAGCQTYNCKDVNGNYFCDNPVQSSACTGGKCLYSQPCSEENCKIYSCASAADQTLLVNDNLRNGNLLYGSKPIGCIPPRSDREISPEPTEPSPPPLPCAVGLDQNGHCSFVETGLGINISTDPAGFIKSIFGLVLGLSGGLALLLIIFSGYQLMAAQGNPEKLQAARDQLIAAIIGLIFIIFSLVILQIIGVDILRIPGFER